MSLLSKIVSVIPKGKRTPDAIAAAIASSSSFQGAGVKSVRDEIKNRVATSPQGALWGEIFRLLFEEPEVEGDEELDDPAAAPAADNSAIKAEIVRLAAENAALRAARAPALTVRENPETGTISVYGLGRFPTSLYKEQWIRLLAQAASLSRFVESCPSRPRKAKAPAAAPAKPAAAKL